MITCFNCGESGHIERDCPARLRAIRAERSQPPPPRPRTERDPAIARQWADAIRDALGWHQPEENQE